PDIQGPHPVEDGDIFLLCSDGLSGPLSDREIGAVGSVLPPPEACEFLVDLANLRGGPDNITLIVVRLGAKSESKGRARDVPVERASLLSRIPWPLWILLLGVLLAGAAFGLIYNKLPGEKVAFGAAAVTIVAGLICLGVYHVQQKNRPESEPEYRPRTKVYRES